MSDNHYFASSPEGPLVPREITVTLNGNKYSVLTAGGVFSPEHIDQGTQVLLAHLEKANPSGNFLDIGCGWGPIALALAFTIVVCCPVFSIFCCAFLTSRYRKRKQTGKIKDSIKNQGITDDVTDAGFSGNGKRGGP